MTKKEMQERAGAVRQALIYTRSCIRSDDYARAKVWARQVELDVAHLQEAIEERLNDEDNA